MEQQKESLSKRLSIEIEKKAYNYINKKKAVKKRHNCIFDLLVGISNNIGALGIWGGIAQGLFSSYASAGIIIILIFISSTLLFALWGKPCDQTFVQRIGYVIISPQIIWAAFIAFIPAFALRTAFLVRHLLADTITNLSTLEEAIIDLVDNACFYVYMLVTTPALGATSSEKRFMEWNEVINRAKIKDHLNDFYLIFTSYRDKTIKEYVEKICSEQEIKDPIKIENLIKKARKYANLIEKEFKIIDEEEPNKRWKTRRVNSKFLPYKFRLIIADGKIAIFYFVIMEGDRLHPFGFLTKDKFLVQFFEVWFTNYKKYLDRIIK